MKREIDRAGNGPGRREAFECQVELGRRALGLMMAVEARQTGLGSIGGMKPAGLMTNIVASFGSGSRYRPSAPVTATSRPLETARREAPDWRSSRPRSRSRSSNTVPEMLRLCPRASASRFHRRKRDPARRADQHVAPR